MSEIVKAVGFAAFAPEVVMIHYKYGSKDRLHLFPSKFGNGFDLEEDYRNVVLLNDASKRHQLASKAGHIYRLLVFGTPEDLDRLGIPCIDAQVQNGKILEIPRQTPEGLSARIQKEAVEIDLSPPIGEKKPAEDEVKPKPKTKRRLSWWFDKVLASVPKKWHSKVREATVQRIVDDLDRDDFKKVCSKLVKLGVPKATAKAFYKWVEGTDGDGVFLGQAVNHYFEAEDQPKIADAAEEFSVDAEDVRMVIAIVEKIDEAEEGDE